MSTKKQLALLTAFAMMGGLTNSSQIIDVNNVNTALPLKPIPKGCKEYWFNKHGGFSTEKMRHDEIVFKCVASNDKTAKAKFAKWDKI